MVADNKMVQVGLGMLLEDVVMQLMYVFFFGVIRPALLALTHSN